MRISLFFDSNLIPWRDKTVYLTAPQDEQLGWRSALHFAPKDQSSIFNAYSPAPNDFPTHTVQISCYLQHGKSENTLFSHKDLPYELRQCTYTT